MAKGVVPELTDGDDPVRLVDEPSRRKGRFWRTTQLLILAASLGWLWLWTTTPSLSSRQNPVLPSDRVPDIGLPKSFLRKWAQYAPYIPVAKYIPPPPPCTISQVRDVLC